MWEWILGWLWENISNIYSVIGTVMFIWGLSVGILHIKLKRNISRSLNLVIKQSMKYYVPTRAQEIDSCSEENKDIQSIELIPFFIKRAFKDSQKQYYIILADSGMGKTTFLLILFFKYYKKISSCAVEH